MTDSDPSAVNDSTPTVIEALTWAVDWMDAWEGDVMPEWRAWADRARAALSAAQAPETAS